jgi:hypothetical protein
MALTPDLAKGSHAHQHNCHYSVSWFTVEADSMICGARSQFRWHLKYIE